MTEPCSGDERARVFAAAERLQDSMTDLRTDVSMLRTYGQHNRRYIWGLVVSLVLDLALSIVVAVFAVQASEASSVANQSRQAQRTTCEAANQARAVSVQLWSYVLDATSKEPQNQTPERKAQVAQFRTYMESAYAQRDCASATK
jgi:hypothetical protein